MKSAAKLSQRARSLRLRPGDLLRHLPDTGGLDPVAECRANIETIERLREIAAALAEDERLAQAIARQDATISQRIIAVALYGTGG